MNKKLRDIIVTLTALTSLSSLNGCKFGYDSKEVDELYNNARWSEITLKGRLWDYYEAETMGLRGMRGDDYCVRVKFYEKNKGKDVTKSGEKIYLPDLNGDNKVGE